MAYFGESFSETDDHYKKRCPFLPENLRHRDSNNTLAYKTTQLPMKASKI